MARLKNKRRERFCKCYVNNGFNATKAARGAGFSANSCGTEGHRLLQNAEVSTRVMELMNAADELLDMSTAEAMDELNKMANFNIQDFHDDDGHLIPVQELDPDVAVNLQELKTIHKPAQYDDDGKEISPAMTIPLEIKAGKDKTKALDMILRIKNAYEDHEKSGSGTINVYLDEKDMKA